MRAKEFNEHDKLEATGDSREERMERYDYEHEADTVLPQDMTLETEDLDLGVPDASNDVLQPSERTGNAARQAHKRPAKKRAIHKAQDAGLFQETVESARAAAAYHESQMQRQKHAEQER